MILLKRLVEKGIITQEKAQPLEFEIRDSGKKEEEVILGKGIVSENFLFNLKSETYQIPLKDIAVEDVSLKTLELIPEESARYYKMVPLEKKDNVLEVGMVYPEDLKAQEALQFLARRNKFSYRIFLITPSLLNNLLKQYRTLKKEVGKALEELEEELEEEKIDKETVKEIEFEKLAEEAPIIKVVGVILRHAVEGSASDIHIEPGKTKLRVRFRTDGVLYSSLFLPLKIHRAIVARIKILANLKIDETRIPQDGRFSIKVGGVDVDFRVSTFPTVTGEKVAIRVLNPLEGLKSFDQLGLERRNFRVVKKAVEKPFGMILATGPTGSGKTTTLYAILNLLNREGVNIVTLEDPVEYFIEGINQSQVRPEIGYTFAHGLRQVVRQDPDIIMVGEIRDEETASLAIHAALTGHIVLSTLHTNNAIGVIPRLVDLGIKPFLIPPSLNIAIAQRLVRVLCPECKVKFEADEEIQKIIFQEIETLPSSIKNKIKIPSPLTIYKAQGCKRCSFKGFMGRVGVFEILEMTDSLAKIVLKDLDELKLKEEALRQGMITMKQDGILKVLDGVTTLEEVLRVAEE
jgi:type IV pilus assembly protein PilB